jgi:hypothetical protein
MNKPVPKPSFNIIEFFSALSKNPQVALGLLIAGLPAIFGAGYLGVTKYNQVISIIETDDAKEKAIADLKQRYSDIAKEFQAFQKSLDFKLTTADRRFVEQIDGVKTRVESLGDSMIKLQDRTSEALMAARESKTISESSQKEVRSQLTLIRAEVQASLDAVKAEMNALKRASTNPLNFNK